MYTLVAQISSDLLGGAFTIALVAGGLLLAGAFVSFAVFAYRSVKGDGMRDPQEVVPEKTTDDDDLTEGSSDDEWDYY
jgi:hypothetical protein